VIVVADRVVVSEELEEGRIAVLHVEECHRLASVMGRLAGRRAVGRRDRRLQIMETAGRVVLGNVLCVDGTIHLLDHLEVLMDRVAGIGVEWHVRSSHLERTRREVVNVANANIWTEREAQAGATGAEQEFIRGRQTGVACRQQGSVGRQLARASQIGRGQCDVKLLLCHIGTAKEFSVVGRRNDLELVRFGEIRPRRAIRIDDAFRQKVQHLLILFCWLIGGEKVIEAPILADDDNDMFDWCSRRDSVDRLIRIGSSLGLGSCPKAKH
jgi:hypothetical protein